MRTLAAYSSLLAIGLLVGGFVYMVFDGSIQAPGTDPATQTSTGLDFRSMVFGLVLGLALANLSRISWTDLPRRFINWVLTQENNLFYGTIASILLIILIAF